MTARMWRPAPGRLVVLAFVLLLAALLGPGGAAQTDDAALPVAPGQVLATAVHPLWDDQPRTVSTQVPLVEVFTATWCPPCAPADRALDRLLDEQSPGLQGPSNTTAGDLGNDTRNSTRIELAVLEYHPAPDPGAEDPFGVPEGVDRLTRKYGAFWFPSAYVQGILEDAPETRTRDVEAGMEQVFYHSYSQLIRRASAMDQPFVMTTEARLVDGNVTLDVHVVAQRSLEGALYLQGALWQDDLFFRGSNGVDTHRMTVLALSDRRIDPDGMSAGETWTASWTIPAPKGMDQETAGMTVFLESAWDQPDRDGAQVLMTFAAGSATAAAVAVWLMRRSPRRTRVRSEPEGAE